MMILRRLALAGFALLVAASLWAFFPEATRGDENDKSVLGDLISRALTTPATRVSVGQVDGALSSDATIRNITIADRDGVWLRLDTARLVWNRVALLSRRLDIERLEIGHLEILRRPIPSEEPVAGSDEPILPELPLKVIVREFALADLTLGEPVIGTAARIAAGGSAVLGNPSEGLNLVFNSQRLDKPGVVAIRLSLVPQTQALDLAVVVDEPEDGLLARAVNIPGVPPVKFELGGKGTLDAFDANLNFVAGPDINAHGTAALRREGAGRHLGLDMSANVEGLFPGAIAPVFAGTTRLTGGATFGDDGSATIPGIALASQTARLDFSGRISADQVLDLKITAGAVPTQGGRTVAGRAEIKKLAFEAGITGPVASPKVAATLNAEDARLPAGRIDKLDASFTATPSGSLADRTTRTALAGNAVVSGLALTDPALNQAIGDRATLAFRADVDREGTADVALFHLEGRTVDARYTGLVGAQQVRGRLNLEASDLSRFRDLAGLKLGGALTATADLDGSPRYERIGAVVDARATRFTTGIAAVDGLTGGRLTVAGAIRKLPLGGWGFENLRLAGANVTARVDGSATADQAKIDLNVDLPDLRKADARLTGRGAVTAQVTGTVNRPDATARIALSEASALGRPIPQLALDVTARDLTGLVDARATLSGSVGGKPAAGGLHVARRAEGGWSVDGLDLSVGSAALRGAVTLDAANLADGNLSFSARNLDDVSPLALTPLGGDIDAQATLSAAGGRQDAAVTARGAQLRYGSDVSVEKLDARIDAKSINDRPVIDGTVAADRARVGGETINALRLESKGSAAASEMTLKADARGFALDGRGRLVPGDRTRFEIAAFSATRAGRRIALAGPATLTFGDGGVDIAGLTVAVEQGRLSLAGRAGPTLDLTATARAIPLAAVDIVAPGTGLTGTLDGEARVSGSASEPAGDWRLRIARLTAPQTRSSNLPAINVAAAGRLAGGRTTLDATVDAQKAGSVRITGSAPLDPAGSLDLALKGALDLAVANGTLGVAGRRLTGSARLDARLTGTATAPQANGALTISGGTFSDATTGLRLTGLGGRFVARGQEIAIENLSATTRNGGRIGIDGRIALDPARGFPGTIRVSGQNAELMNDGTVTAAADLALNLSGPLAQRPRIDGRVGIVKMDVAVPNRLPSTLRPIEGTKHVHPTPTAKAREAIAAKARARSRGAPPFDAVLDITVTAPGRIYVHGRGLDAELGGDIRVTGTLSAPVPVGAFDLRRGRFSFASIQLDFNRGRLAFDGAMIPQLDFLAETRAGDVLARINVTGPADAPVFTFSSDSGLPQDEVLSRILFNKASGGLSPFQALQLAQTAAQFSDGGDGAFERLRQSLGLSGLDVLTDSGGGPAGAISRALGNRVSIGVKTGATAGETGLSADVDVTKRIRVRGEVNADGNAAVGVGTEWEY